MPAGPAKCYSPVIWMLDGAVLTENLGLHSTKKKISGENIFRNYIVKIFLIIVAINNIYILIYSLYISNNIGYL